LSEEDRALNATLNIRTWVLYRSRYQGRLCTCLSHSPCSRKSICIWLSSWHQSLSLFYPEHPWEGHPLHFHTL